MRRYLAGLLVAVLIVVAVAVSQGALGLTSAPSTGPTAVAILSAPRTSPTAVAIAQASTLFPSTTAALDLSAVQVHRGLLLPGRYDYLNVDLETFNVQFTVPAGWTWNGRYLSKGGVGPPDGAAIFFFGGPVQVYGGPCHWAGAQSTRPTGYAADIVAALAAQPSRSATTPIDHPFGPWSGMAVQLTVPNDLNLDACDGGEFRSWGSWGPGDSNARIHQGPGQRDLVWALDVPGAGVENAQGTLIVAPPVGGLIVDAASFPGTPADVLAEIDAIVGSLHIGYWG